MSETHENQQPEGAAEQPRSDVPPYYTPYPDAPYAYAPQQQYPAPGPGGYPGQGHPGHGPAPRTHVTRGQTIGIAFGAAAAAVIGVCAVLGINDAVGFTSGFVSSHEVQSSAQGSAGSTGSSGSSGSSGNGYSFGDGSGSGSGLGSGSGNGYGQSGSGSSGSGSSGSSGSPFGGFGSGSSGSSGQSGDGSSGGYSGETSQGTTSATTAQSKGVAIVETELKYDQAEAAGTGIVLTSGGEILTNNHVIEGSTAIKVEIVSTGKTYTATVVGSDSVSDVAVLQLQGASGLTPATLDTSTASVGDAVTGVGNAGGTGSLTAAVGRITGTDKSITTQAEESVAAESLTGLLETDADIQSGDSGGPLLDSQGEVVGMDTAASEGGTPDGYAIPIATALGLAHEIIAGDASTDIQLGYPAFLGVEVEASQAGVATNGATVGEVIDGTPAASSGLAAGDVITAVDGTQVASSDALTAALKAYKPGQSVKITWTDASGAGHTATVTLTTGPAA